MPKSLRGGSFNLKYGRDHHRVMWEVSNLFDKHRLHFLAVQEFSDYRDMFDASHGFDVVAGPKGPCESGVIVRPGVPIDKRDDYVYGNGWTTTRKGHFPAAWHYEARIAGWLYVRSVHLPTPILWPNLRPKGPVDRVDDLAATAEGLRRYFAHPCWVNARLAAGDWNEPPSTPGQFTPRWIAVRSGAQIKAPQSLAGHGRIDYTLAKGARVLDIRKDTAIPELSDHEPVLFKVVKGR